MKLIVGKYILGKSDLKKDNYDVLVFAVRSIESILIPSFVEIIGASAFQSCCKLKEIEFTNNSKLRKIEQFSIAHILISKICIPKHVKLIGECAFMFCRSLLEVEFSTDSELQVIEKGVFDGTPIECLTIPSNVVEIKADICPYATKLNNIKVSQDNRFYISIDDKIILGKSNQENDVFNVLVFAAKTIKTAIIPNFVEYIGPFSFNQCEKLRKIEFSENSKLYAIKEEAFNNSSIKSFIAPSNLNIIDTNAFFCVKLLLYLIFLIIQNFALLKKKALAFTNIACFFIPSSVTFIGPNAFLDCVNLQIIELDENSKLQSFNDEIFSQNMNTLLMIPFKLSIKLNLNKQNKIIYT